MAVAGPVFTPLERTLTLAALEPQNSCLFAIYKKEGDELYSQHKYKRAITKYNEVCA